MFWYLASPYSRYPFGLDAAFRLAAKARALLVKDGVPCFSPIVHSHPVAVIGQMDPTDHSIWLPSERPMLDACSGLIMLQGESWRLSYGMAHERELFRSAGKTIVWMRPDDVTLRPEPDVSE